MSNNFVMAITPTSAATSNGLITYTYTLTMDAPASVEESIDYRIQGIGSTPASIDDLAKNQALYGTVVFAPGEMVLCTMTQLHINLPLPMIILRQ